LGAGLVALVLISGQLGSQVSGVAEALPKEAPITLAGVGVQLSATSELRAGESPILPGADSQAFVAEIVTPRIGLELRRPDFTLQLFYSLRLFWEDPSPIQTITTDSLSPNVVTRIRGQARTTVSDSGPLILHTVGLNLTTRPSRSVSAVAAASGSIGSPDFTALPQVLGTVQGTLPPIVSIVSGTAQGNLHYEVNRRWALGLGANVAYWRWLDLPASPTASTTTGQTTVMGQTLVTGQTSASAEPGATLILSKRDTLGFGAAVGAVVNSDGAGVSTLTPALSWRSRLTARDNLRLIAGVTYARALGTTPPGLTPLLGSSGTAVAPIGSLEFESHLLRRDEILVLASAGAGVDYYVDPVLGAAVPRAMAGAGMSLIAAPRWMFTLRGDFGTAIRTTPFQTLVNGVPVAGVAAPDETVFTVSLGVRRWFSHNLLAEIGGRWADRAPALVTPDFAFHQRQLWIYLSLTATTLPISRLGQ